jgi:hypothetical protein
VGRGGGEREGREEGWVEMKGDGWR